MTKIDYETVIGPDSASYGPQGSRVVYNTGALGGIVTVANVLVAAIIIYALSRDAGSGGVVAAIVTGALYYGITTSFALLVLSGSLAQIVTRRDEQITLRALHQLQFGALSAPIALPPADPPQTPSLPEPENYVAPVDDESRRAALAYIRNLYDADGNPNPRCVVVGASSVSQEGRLRVPAPPQLVRDWLVARGLIQPIMHRGQINGYRLDLSLCPTRYDALSRLRFGSPVPPG